MMIKNVKTKSVNAKAAVEKKSVTVAENAAELGSNLRKTNSKVTVIHGNLVLKKDTTFEHSIHVEGDIVGKKGLKYDLKVKEGDIAALGSVITRHIIARNIEAQNIIAYGNIIASGDITVDFILCEKLKQPEGKRLECKNLIEKYSTYKWKEVKR